MITQLFRLISKIIGIYADTVPAHQSRTESGGVPFGIHSVHYFIRINAHPVKYHCQLVHKSNIYIPLAVFHNFYCFRCLNGADRVRARPDNQIINRPDHTQTLFVHSTDNFAYIRQRMDFISRIDAFRTVARFKINTAC